MVTVKAKLHVCPSYTLPSWIQTTGATLPPSDHVSVSGLQAEEQLTDTKELVRLRIVLVASVFRCLCFLSLSCLSCTLKGQKVKRNRERHTLETQIIHLSIYCTCLFLIGKLEPLEGRWIESTLNPG